MSNPRLKVVVVVPNYWGKGDTLKEAWENVTLESGKGKRELKRSSYYVYVVPETDENIACVNQIGSLCWADVEGIAELIIDQG
jgi:hypothetical protein